MSFEKLRKINVNDHTEKKNGLTYLSWAWAWDEFKQACPDATYEIIKSADGLPYFESKAGAIVYTKVTANGETHEMWLPVMDSRNNAMKSEPYKYIVNDYKTRQPVEKTVDAFTMFDINKTVMRCLVKNLAMFGLGLYIYSGEDLPEADAPDVSEHLKAIESAQDADELKKAYVTGYKAAGNNVEAQKAIIAAKDKRKGEL